MMVMVMLVADPGDVVVLVLIANLRSTLYSLSIESNEEESDDGNRPVIITQTSNI